MKVCTRGSFAWRTASQAVSRSWGVGQQIEAVGVPAPGSRLKQWLCRHKAAEASFLSLGQAPRR